MTHQLQNLRNQAAKLRRLSQPYFFPYTEDNGWQFLGLLVSLLFCVAGIVLFLVTGLMNGLSWLLPELSGQYLGGVQSSLAMLWSRGWGRASVPCSCWGLWCSPPCGANSGIAAGCLGCFSA